MLGVVRDYQKQMHVLDGKAQALGQGDEGRRAAGFAALNREREEMIRQRVASLQSHLSPDAFSRLKRQIDEHVKPRVKMRARGPEQSQHLSDETPERREARRSLIRRIMPPAPRAGPREGPSCAPRGASSPSDCGPPPRPSPKTPTPTRGGPIGAARKGYTRRSTGPA